MPRVPRTGTLVIEKPMGGWALDFSQSSSDTVEAQENKYARSGGGISLFRVGRIGDIASGETWAALADSGSRVNELPLNGVVGSNVECFTVLRNGRLVRFGVGDEIIDNNYDPSLGGTHAAHTIATSENNDVIAGKDNSGTERIFSTWEDNVDADIQIINPDGSGQDSDWFSTLSGSGVLTKGVPHMLCQGTVDNDMFCLNGQYVARADLSAGTGNPQALNLGNGWIGSSIERAGNYIQIAGYRANIFGTSHSFGKSRVWLWDGHSDNPTFAYDVDDNYISRINQDLSIVTQGRNNTTKFQRFTGDIRNPYRVVFESQQIGAAPRHGSVETFQSMIHWGASGAEKLFCMDGDAFHYRSTVTDGTNIATDIGMVRNLNQNILYLGIKTGVVYKIYKISYAGYNINSDFVTRLYKLPYKSTITNCTVYFSQFGSGASVMLSLFKDYNTISLGGAQDLMNRTLTQAALGSVTSFSFPIFIYDVNSFFMNIRFNHASITSVAAMIRRIELDYEETIDKF